MQVAIMEHIHLMRWCEFNICFGMNDLSAAHREWTFCVFSV